MNNDKIVTSAVTNPLICVCIFISPCPPHNKSGIFVVRNQTHLNFLLAKVPVCADLFSLDFSLPLR